MTKAQRADGLLIIAARWQIDRAAGSGPLFWDVDVQRSGIWAWVSGGKNDGDISNLRGARSVAASLALSEVGALGFEVEW